MIRLKVAVLVSGGKDSIFATWCAMHQHDVIALIGVIVKDSLVYHVQKSIILESISRCLDIPMILKEVSSKYEEEKALEQAIRESRAEAVIIGGILSDFQRYHFNRIAMRCGVPVFAPLWRKNQESLVREMITSGFETIFTSVSAMGLTIKQVGQQLDEQELDNLVSLGESYGMNVAGEGGEYETLVLDAPCYKRKLIIDKARIEWDEVAEVGEYVIESSRCVNKL